MTGATRDWCPCCGKSEGEEGYHTPAPAPDEFVDWELKYERLNLEFTRLQARVKELEAEVDGWKSDYMDWYDRC